MADGQTRAHNEEVSTFLANFPTQLHYSQTKFHPHIWVFWNQSERSQNNPSCGVSDPWMIHEKIKSAFSNLFSSHINGLIQFWAPVESGGRLLLSTCNQSFVLENLGPCFLKYRLCCHKYEYSISNVNNLEVEDPPMIISGAPSSAFLNHLPQVVNLKVNNGCPLVCSALKCELTTCLVLPVFDPASQCSNCVGVVEYCMKQSHVFQILNDLKRALEMVGLSMFPEKDYGPYKAIRLKPATYKIKEALEIVCESLNLTLAQVWITYENENHEPYLSSLENTTRKRKFSFKLIGYCADTDEHLKEYYDTCDAIPLITGEGIVGKTLETHQPHFCRNINDLKDNGLLALIPTSSECSCLLICLRSIDTGDVDYAFEFLWPKSRDCFILMKSLLLALKSCLPSFVLASGANFGDELCVLEVGNSTRTENKNIKIFNGNKLSQPLLTSVTSRGHQTTIWKNHEESDFCESKTDSNKEDQIGNEEHSVSINNLRCLGNDKVIIKAEYGDNRTVTYLPISSKVEDVKKNIDETYKLSSGSYKLEFLDFEDEWLTLDDEADWKSCRICWDTIPIIRLRVLPLGS